MMTGKISLQKSQG